MTNKSTFSNRFRFPYHINIEERTDESPKWLSPILTLISVIAALIFSGILIASVGGDPLYTYSRMWNAAFGSWFALSDSFTKAIPLILCGTACALAFQMKIWNIGAEGQFFLGAFGASLVVLAPIVPEGSPAWVYIPVMMLSGMVFGALWGVIPGLLKARLNVNEIISTLMLNYIAIAWNNFFLFGMWSDKGFQMSKKFPKEALLTRLSDIAKTYDIKALRGMTLHLGLFFAIFMAIVIYIMIYKSKWGYEIKLLGESREVARYAGINISRNIVLIMVVSGAIAGLAGATEISGVVKRFQGSISDGYGYTGIIIAWLAKLNPLLTIPVSLFFGGLIIAGREIQPSGIPTMIQGIILVCLIAFDFFLNYRIRITSISSTDQSMIEEQKETA